MDRVADRMAGPFGAGGLFLRRAMLADAILSGAAGIAFSLGAGPLGAALGLPGGLLRGVGVVALAWAGVTATVGAREQVPRKLARVAVGGNLLWAVGSVLLLLSGWVEPTALGYAFVLGQAVAVTLLTEWQYVGMRRSGLR